MSGASREKTQDEVDLERAFDLFDRAFTSNDQRVKDAFRTLMVITALTDNETTDQKWGPFRTMTNDITNLRRRIDSLERQLSPSFSNSATQTELEDIIAAKQAAANSVFPPMSLGAAIGSIQNSSNKAAGSNPVDNGNFLAKIRAAKNQP